MRGKAEYYFKEIMIINNRDRLSHLQLRNGFISLCANQPIEWRIDQTLIPYEMALTIMQERVDAIYNGTAPEMIWLLEHPPLYTAGTSTNMQDLLQPDFLPVYQTGRGGELTYHGPGQRVIYVMLDLRKRQQDLRLFIAALEEWVIQTLKIFHLHGERREDRVGVWIKRPEKPMRNGVMCEDKIAAIGIRVRRWISFHGISINVHPNLSHYTGIVPCGIQHYGVTSFADLQQPVSLAMLDSALQKTFHKIFIDTDSATCPK